MRYALARHNKGIYNDDYWPFDLDTGVRRATQPKANVVFAPIGCLVLAVLVLRPSRTILDACLFCW